MSTTQEATSTIESVNPKNLDANVPEQKEAEDFEGQSDLHEVLQHIRELGSLKQREILQKTRDRLQCDDESIAEAFNLLRSKILADEGDYESENDEESAEENGVATEATEEPEDADVDLAETEAADEADAAQLDADEEADSADADVSEDEDIEIVDSDTFQAELESAFTHVRKVGAQHAAQLVDLLADTFAEVTGRNPSTKELSDMMQRAKSALQFEAEDELLSDEDSDDYEDDEEIDDAAQENNDASATEPQKEAKPAEVAADSKSAVLTFERMEFSDGENDSEYSPENDDNTQVIENDKNDDNNDDADETPIEVFNDSNESAASSDLIESAIKNFTEITGRNPTSNEISLMAKQLQNTSFLDQTFESDAEDSDYQDQDEPVSEDDEADYVSENEADEVAKEDENVAESA